MAKPSAHFLHLSKTGGTAVKAALRDATDAGRYHLVLHTHRTRLRDIPPGEKFFFFLRDPLARYTSGFYSRRREGRPRYDFPWSAAEAKAFGRFQTPNALALALAGRRLLNGPARKAMAAIEHVRDGYTRWIDGPSELLSRSSDLLHVGFTETLEQDFEILKRKLGLPAELRLPEDPVASHRTPGHLDRALDERGRAALEKWYRKDYELIESGRAHGLW
jgi:hypothetical protein